jgi:hypothetical protein
MKVENFTATSGVRRAADGAARSVAPHNTAPACWFRDYAGKLDWITAQVAITLAAVVNTPYLE